MLHIIPLNVARHTLIIISIPFHKFDNILLVFYRYRKHAQTLCFLRDDIVGFWDVEELHSASTGGGDGVPSLRHLTIYLRFQPECGHIHLHGSLRVPFCLHVRAAQVHVQEKRVVYMSARFEIQYTTSQSTPVFEVEFPSTTHLDCLV